MTGPGRPGGDAPADGRGRVVVTGMGCLSPVGNDRASTWSALCEGRSGIAPITLFDPAGLPSRIIGEVKGFDAVGVFGAKEVRRTSRPVLLGISAAREAVADSGLDIEPIADEVAVIVASGIGDMEVLERASVAYHERGHKAVSAYTAMATLVDMPAGMIAMKDRV
ncbi:MAG: beta-ketoacyl synthase N-terminal-like domain-containing protein [Acidimicrobiales bacterium]